MKNKKLIIIGLVLSFILICFFIYKIIQPEDEVNEEPSEEVSSNLEDLHLYKAGEDGEQNFRDASKKVDQFETDDFFGVTGFYNDKDGGHAQIHILDNNEDIIEKEVMSFKLEETEEKSNFDACCSNISLSPGSYYITLNVDDKETDVLLPFELVEN